MYFELFNVIITNISKWYTSGKTNNHRKLGFFISVIVSALWVTYFFNSKQYWLSGNSAVTILLSARGVYNNWKTAK